jgi:hypothetical protein
MAFNKIQIIRVYDNLVAVFGPNCNFRVHKSKFSCVQKPATFINFKGQQQAEFATHFERG